MVLISQPLFLFFMMVSLWYNRDLQTGSWGMSAQLKLIIDKCYCRGLQLKNKKVGTIVVGGSPVDSIQYELIDKQFDCMAKYLSWDMLFKKSYYATARDELEKNKDSMNELEGIGKNL